MSRPKRSTLLEPGRPTLDPAPRVAPTLFQPDSTSPRPTSSSSSSHPTAARPPARDDVPSQAPKPVYGNYLNYYERRNALDPLDDLDDRLALVPREWLKGKRVLDVGCNAGAVTIQLARDLGAAKVTGVDIDPDLTRKAKGNLDLAWSRQAPLKRLVSESAALSAPSRKRRTPSESEPQDPVPPDGVAYRESEPAQATSSPDALANDPFVSDDSFYFPSSLGRMYGYLPNPRGLLTRHIEVPASSVSKGSKKKKRKSTSGVEASAVETVPDEVKAFPENVKIVTADWVHEPIEQGREQYDVIVAFSVTKWIHLQHLNAGLLTFFQRCFSTLSPAGILVLEPQPFASYLRSAKTSPELRHHWELLREGAQRGWRWEDGEFEKVLLELVGFEKRSLLGETGKVGSTFRRPVEVYSKRGPTSSVPKPT
ncbi:hypothetical protein JCM10212_005186 [Sporobolomyces blumeae]